MVKPPRTDVTRLSLEGFEAWLREHLTSPSLAFVLATVMQVIRALFAENQRLRSSRAGRGKQPPSERSASLARQLAFVFAVPANDVSATTPAPKDGAEPPTPKDAKPRKKTEGSGRRSLAESAGHLPRHEERNSVPEGERTCVSCCVPMRPLKPRETRCLEYIPGHYVVWVRLDEVLACPHCDAIVCAAAPPDVLERGVLGPRLVSEALCDKVLDAKPIERFARNARRSGAPVDASTLGRAVASVLDLIVPLAQRIFVRVQHSAAMQCDATGLPVLDAAVPKGIHRDTLWVLVGDRRWVSFRALVNGDGASLEALFTEAHPSCVQCDGTSVTNFVETRWNGARPGCHAHARRKLVAAARVGDLRALVGIELYRALFAIEKRATKAGLSEEQRREVRGRASVPLLEKLRAWVLALAPNVEPKSELGEALTYLQKQWLRLSLFVLDGSIELTNNRSERELRPWVLGRHTWLFVGDETNAQRWAAVYSVVHTAMAHGLNPRAYLAAVIERLRAGHPAARLDELLPDAMLRANPALADPIEKQREERAKADATRAAQAA